jgi:DNA-binding NarL/FixJ family response regulator
VKQTAVRLSLKLMTRTVSVFLIEDNRLLRDGLSTMLTAQGLSVVAAAGRGEDALREVARVKPQLVLLDSAVGDRDGARFVKEVKDAYPDVRVIVMGLLPAHEAFVSLVKAGAAGFILKDASIEVFVATVRAVSDGVSVLPSPMTGTLFSHVAAQATSRGRLGVKGAVRMTARERQVIESIADGLSNKEIAGRLHIATHTVKSHVHNILQKLALHSRLGVAIYAHDQEKGLVSG